VRALFAPAEQEWQQKGEASGLHVIIIDEMDALCTRRSGAGEENSPAQHLYDGVVDQILAKMDGLSEQDNVLVLGLTNRKDVIDPALLRPGRFEVHVRIGYPDEAGRRDILEVHTEKMRGQGIMSPSIDLGAIAKASEGCSGADIAGIVRDASGRAMERSFHAVMDVARQSAGGAQSRPHGATAGASTGGLMVTREDFEDAVDASREECTLHEKEAADGEGRMDRSLMKPTELRQRLQPGGMLAAKPLRAVLGESARFIASAWGVVPPEPSPDHSSSRQTHSLTGSGTRRVALAPAHVTGTPSKPTGYAGATLLLHGPKGSGKTAMAAELARYFAVPGGTPMQRQRQADLRASSPAETARGTVNRLEHRVRVITPEQLLGMPQA